MKLKYHKGRLINPVKNTLEGKHKHFMKNYVQYQKRFCHESAEINVDRNHLAQI